MTDPLEAPTIITAPASPFTGPRLPTSPGIASVHEAGTIGRLVLRAGPDALEALLETLPSALSGAINTATSADGCNALRLGPDEWLLLAEPESDPWLAARIADGTRNVAVSLVDVSHRDAGLLVSGSEAATVLAVGCPLPLHEEAFPIGRASRTVFAKAGIVLWRRAPDTFQIEVARSYAPYVSALVRTAIDNETAIAAARGA